MGNLCFTCYYRLWDIQRVRRYLNHETVVKVANALVSSRLDSLLYHTKKAYTDRLQRVQNVLYICRTVYKLHKFSHVTPFLHYRILFKYNLLTYKAIYFSQSLYFSSLDKLSDLTQGSRLSISLSKLKKVLCRFAVAAFTEWNKLPQSISIPGFRKQLKTYLFRLAYLHHSLSPLTDTNMDTDLLFGSEPPFWIWTIPF